MMTPASPFSILFRVGGTLTARYWITSGEPRRFMLHALDSIGRVDKLVFLDSSEISDDLNDMRRKPMSLTFR
jgi:hypothetical protein